MNVDTTIALSGVELVIIDGAFDDVAELDSVWRRRAGSGGTTAEEAYRPPLVTAGSPRVWVLLG